MSDSGAILFVMMVLLHLVHLFGGVVLLSANDIQSELSYAYLHAVASKLGVSCEVAARHSDENCVDARLQVHGALDPTSVFKAFAVDVQLKSASGKIAETDTRYALQLKKHQYERLRQTNRASSIVLVLLVLPHKQDEWLVHSQDGLITRRCCYWTSFYGAPEATAEKPTVHVPKANVLSLDGARSLLVRLSRGERIPHAP